MTEIQIQVMRPEQTEKTGQKAKSLVPFAGMYVSLLAFLAHIVNSLRVRWQAAGLDDLVPAVVAFVVIAIIGVVGLLILGGFSQNSLVANNPAAANGIAYGNSAINTILSFLPLLGLVVVAAAILVVVIYAFQLRGSREERF